MQVRNVVAGDETFCAVRIVYPMRGEKSLEERPYPFAIEGIEGGGGSADLLPADTLAQYLATAEKSRQRRAGIVLAPALDIVPTDGL